MTEQQIVEKLEYAKKTDADYLYTLFDIQNTFDNYIKEKRHLDYTDTNYWIAQMCRCIIHESVELTDLTNWKHWKNRKELDMEKIVDETIDIWHFLISLSLKIGLNPKDILNAYVDKNLENYKRQLGTSEKQGYN